MKRLTALVLSLAMVLTLCVPAFAAQEGWSRVTTYHNQFQDVPPDSWFGDSVRTAYEYGIMTGTSDTAFNPGGTVTFAEAVALAARLVSVYAGEPIPEEASSPWYRKYADVLYDHGVLVEGESYPYDEAVGRQTFARLIVCVIPKGTMPVVNESIKLGMIPDLSTGSPYYDAAFALVGGGMLGPDEIDWYGSMPGFSTPEAMGDPYNMEEYDSIYAAYQWGVLTGNDPYGTFAPSSTISRAEVAALMSRVCVPSLRRQVTFVRQPARLVPADRLANLPSVAKGASASQMQEAYDVARQIAQVLSPLSREAQLFGITMALRNWYDAGMEYSMSSPHYNDPYGYFVLRSASCAGCTRATGMVLNMLGIPYEHVNEDGYTHQWCRVNVDGTWWICDAYGLYCGPEPAPYEHPNLALMT